MHLCEQPAASSAQRGTATGGSLPSSLETVPADDDANASSSQTGTEKPMASTSGAEPRDTEIASEPPITFGTQGFCPMSTRIDLFMLWSEELASLQLVPVPMCSSELQFPATIDRSPAASATALESTPPNAFADQGSSGPVGKTPTAVGQIRC